MSVLAQFLVAPHESIRWPGKLHFSHLLDTVISETGNNEYSENDLLYFPYERCSVLKHERKYFTVVEYSPKMYRTFLVVFKEPSDYPDLYYRNVLKRSTY
jgi:hypothetical protein